MMTRPTELQIEPSPANFSERYQLRQLELTSGALGKIFGAAHNAATNIGGVVAVSLTLTVILIVAFRGTAESVEFAKVAVPLITLVLGYLFGKHQ